MKNIISWFAGNHVAANLLMLFFLVAGITTALGIKMEILPDTALDAIEISVAYPGASPAEVEEGVIRQIEENVAGIEGIRRIDSVARESLGLTTIEVMKDWDSKKLLDEVKSEIDRITTLPVEAEEPVVREATRRIQVISTAVYGDVPEATIKNVAQDIKDDLTSIEGITQADIAAIRPDEIHIEISEQTLRKYGLTLGMVADAVAESSLDLPAGSVDAREGEVLIRAKGRRYTAEEYREIPVITRTNGTRITLGRIADISEGFADVDLSAHFQGKPAAIINVYRVANQSALEVAAKVRDYVEALQPGLPDGLSVKTYQDMSTALKSRIELLTSNLFLGLVLVSFLLGLFLNLRLAFWVTLGIPVSFAFGLLMIPQFDVSLNMISLFAFIMVLGIVVDDAIIVSENVFRHQEAGLPPLKAAAVGTAEVARPVIFSVLTTMVAFWPLLLAGGNMGKMMRNIPIVVIVVLLGSLIESLFILPAHLAGSKALKKPKTARPGKTARALQWVIEKPYQKILDACIRWRYATAAVGLVVLLLTIGIWNAGIIKFTFLPKVEGDVMQCLVTMPAGTPEARTRQVVERIEQQGQQMLADQDKKRPKDAPPLMEYSSSVIGAHMAEHMSGGDAGGHLAHVMIQLLDGEKRKIGSEALTRLWRQAVGPIPDAESVVFKSEIQSSSNPVEVHLSLDNQDQLLAASDALKADLKKFSGVFDVSDSYMPGKMEMQLALKSEADSLGLKLNDLAQQVRHAFYGAEALRFQRDKNEVKVLVRYPENERQSLANVEQMRIRTPAGDEVPFSKVAEVRMERGYASIERAQRLRVIKVTADVDEKTTNANEVRQYLTGTFLPKLKADYPGLRTTIEGEGQDQKELMSDITRGLFIALFCIYALLAVPFRSFSQPLIVMSAIPFGIVGAILGHLLMGFNISIISLFGIVGLSGVVVNDSLVLIDKINSLRREGGLPPHDAVIEAGKLRFRAILLTSITTFGGLTPMLMERSIQAQFLIPMAISLGFGVMFATFVTLLLVPCGYMILDDSHRGIARLRGRMRPADIAEALPGPAAMEAEEGI